MPISPKQVAALADIIFESAPAEYSVETRQVVYSIIIKPMKAKEKLRQLAAILNDGLHFGNWPGYQSTFEAKS